MAERDRAYQSFRNANPPLLSPVLDQGRTSLCWSIPPTRQLEALLRLYHPRFPQDGTLSVQELINLVPVVRPRDCGAISDLETATTYLLSPGLVFESLCRLTFVLNQRRQYRYPPQRWRATYTRVYDIDHDADGRGDMVEEMILQEFAVGPVSVAICALSSYFAWDGQGVFVPNHDDDMDRGDFHVVLVTGSGVNANGIPFLEIQESYGESCGVDDGFFRLAMGYSMFRMCIIMRVL
ncbi:hypothetical protein AALP_AA3G028600 [Arabis alpina]|uniref:Peptidase C1A papain C-terminal domain-containing protein n=1 Tax=Arabis alpina TaxID=50452 RepID=A0A087H6N0_ARAAL|nr:hypothetical protein AALP_AA3G028600 [Arabis alpina]